MPSEFLILVVVAYLSGSLPWSVWLSKRVSGVDPRTSQDGNPGAANAFRLAGARVGIAVAVLDFLKAFAPVFVAWWMLDLPDAQVFWIALAPMVGHAFSVFLRFRGGRGITTLFGVWSGITLYEIPIIMGAGAFLVTKGLKNDEITTLTLPVVVSSYLLITGRPVWMIGLALAQLLILVAKISVFYLRSFRRLPGATTDCSEVGQESLNLGRH